MLTIDGRIGITVGPQVLYPFPGYTQQFLSFTELQRLARRLGLRSALNLDGGGSTTMWVAGRIVNRPSDPGGPRKVSDAILVVPR